VPKQQGFKSDEWLDEAELSIIRQAYGGLVDYLDYQLHSFLKSLEEIGELENTVLIITADHGKHLGEHGMIGHSHFLFDEVLQVPLLISGPGIPENSSRTDLVSLVDLFSTIYDICNILIPDDTDGIPLFSGPRPGRYFCGVWNPRCSKII
jgi:arylsulfatase A-like enzyme